MNKKNSNPLTWGDAAGVILFGAFLYGAWETGMIIYFMVVMVCSYGIVWHAGREHIK